MAIVQFNLRIPEELKQKIDDASKESGRSINAEAAYRLEQSFSSSTSDDFLQQQLKEAIERYKNTDKKLSDIMTQIQLLKTH